MSQHIWKKQARHNWIIFTKAGLPFILGGMAVVFLGMYGLRRYLGDSDYLSALLLLWFAVFWMIYQPLFHRRVRRLSNDLKKNG